MSQPKYSTKPPKAVLGKSNKPGGRNGGKRYINTCQYCDETKRLIKIRAGSRTVYLCARHESLGGI